MRHKILLLSTVLLASFCVFEGLVDHQTSANAAQIVTVPVAAQPDALVRDGPFIWVASCSGNAIDEIDPNGKRVIESLEGTTNGLDCPDAITVLGPNIWVANRLNSSLAEIKASTGALVATISGPDILNPVALAVAGSRLLVLNNFVNSDDATSATPYLSEIDSSNGLVMRTISNPPPKDYHYQLIDPLNMIVSGGDVWVADGSNSFGLEFNIDSGAYIRHTAFGGPFISGVNGISCRGGRMWLSSFNNAVVSEYSTATGAFIRSIKTSPNPYQLVFAGQDLFVETQSPDTVREYATTGALLRTVVRSTKSLGKGISTMLVDGTHLWTANYSTNSITESTF